MEIRTFLSTFRRDFLQACSDGVITKGEWQKLRASLERANINGEEAAVYVRNDALQFLERTLAFAAAAGTITDMDVQMIHDLRRDLAIPPEAARPVLERLDFLKSVAEIRKGHLPTIRPRITLEADELCYLETQASYLKINKRSTSTISGRLVATSKRLNFLSTAGGWVIRWNNIMRVDNDSHGIYLELSTKRGNGTYQVADALYTQAVLDTVTRMVKRQLITPETTEEGRHIPQDVKIAVWQRDQGKCAQCGATSYLEFDHIIPVSKGGASTIKNVQLLCRRHNSEKGARI